jgi:hypothetical protein
MKLPLLLLYIWWNFYHEYIHWDCLRQFYCLDLQREEMATLPVLDPGLIGTGRTRGYRMLYRGPGFLAVVRFVSTPPPSPLSLSKLGRQHTERQRKRDNLLTVEGGKG